MTARSTADINRILQGGAPDVAIRRMAALVDAGDADAMFETAVWHLIGQPLPRDLPRARMLLSAARARGHGDAALFEVALCANGSGGAPDWQTARQLLEHAAGAGGAAAVQRSLLRTMSLNVDGAPATVPEGQPLTAGGTVARFRGFATPAECTHVMGCVADLLKPALVVDPRTGRQVPHPVRTSDAAVIGPTREDLVIRALNLRIAAATATDVAQGEALTVLRYRPGQQFRLHSDALAGTRNQRVMTMLLYLNDDCEGGETVFPSHDLTVRPRRGDALLFHNVDREGRPDPAMQHAGLPVSAGTKWLATRWIRARSFSPWSGPDDA